MFEVNFIQEGRCLSKQRPFAADIWLWYAHSIDHYGVSAWITKASAEVQGAGVPGRSARTRQ